MPQLPAGWHPQAARRGTAKLSWAPGWQGTGMQPIRAVPVGRYTRRISGVPLTGGQAQGQIPGFPGFSGSVTSPGPFVGITSGIMPVAGTYTVDWTVTLGGAAGAGDANGFLLFQVPENITVATSVNAGAPGIYPQTPAVVTVNAGDFLVVFSGAGPTAGAIYSASVAGVGLPLQLQVGPQGLATTWYPAQVTLSTTTGVLDTSTALIYLGPAVTPATQVGQVFTGNGTAALAIPAMQPGQTIIVQWVNGHGADTAAMNVIGTMDAIGTG